MTIVVLKMRFVTSKLVNASAVKVLEDHVAINAYLVSTTILIVYLATVQRLEAFKMFVIQLENVLAYQTLLANNVRHAVLVIINIQNVYPVTVTRMDLVDFLATMKDNVNVNTTLMAKLAINAENLSIISQLVKIVIVILRVLSLNLQDVAQYQLVNYVSAKKEFKEEFATNVDHFTGI